MEDDYPGLFVTLEGVANTGKSTLSDTAKQALTGVITTAEPRADMATGKATRELLEERDSNPVSDFHFFVGHRADHLAEVVKPALMAGKTVICERYSDSTRAYQPEKLQYHVEDPEEYIEAALDESWHLTPDLTLLIDVSVGEALKRAGPEHKYEEPAMLERVRQNYLDLAADHDRIIKVDGEQSLDAVKQFSLAVIDEAQGQKASQALYGEDW